MNNLLRLVSNAVPEKKRYILFVGAGVSKDASLPTGWDIMLDTAEKLRQEKDPNNREGIEEWFLNSSYKNLKYSELMELLHPSSFGQQEYLNKFFEAKQPGLAHWKIVEFARRGIVKAIVTTNFDHCIESACAQHEVQCQIISTDSDIEDAEPLAHCEKIRIYKPHGTLGKGALKNTPKDLEALSPPFFNHLVKVFCDYGLIVIGYAGLDEDILHVLREMDIKHFPSFWINPVPPSGELEILLNMKKFDYIECSGANAFFEDYLKLSENLIRISNSSRTTPRAEKFNKVLAYGIKNAEHELRELLINYCDDLFLALSRLLHVKMADDVEAEVNQLVLDFDNLVDSVVKFGNFSMIEELFYSLGKMCKSCVECGTLDFNGNYQAQQIVREMFVIFIAKMIRHEMWDRLGEILRKKLFYDDGKKLISFSYLLVDKCLDYFDEKGQTRGKPESSLVGRFSKKRFESGTYDLRVEFREFMEADYFLFLRGLVERNENDPFRRAWCPRSCIYVAGVVPRYLSRSISRGYMVRFVHSLPVHDAVEFRKRIENDHNMFSNYWPREIVFSPLENFNFKELASTP